MSTSVEPLTSGVESSRTPLRAADPVVEEALEAARHLARHGVPIFIARPAMNVSGMWDPTGGTDGMGYWLPKGWQQTEADPAAVDRWRRGDALCALMGDVVDLFDNDPRNGGEESLAALEQEGAVPRSYGHAVTPSGGTHDLIAALGVGSRDGLRPGIDLKGGRPDGSGRGFGFIAPTVKMPKHGKGQARAYRWTRVPDLSLLDGSDTSGARLAAIARPQPRATPSPAPALQSTGGQALTGSDLENYINKVVRDELAHLRASHDWPVGHSEDGGTNDRGEVIKVGWERLCANVAYRFGELLKMPGSGLDYSRVRRAYLDAAPRGGYITDDYLIRKWDTQYDRAQPAEPPTARAPYDHAAAVDTFLTQFPAPTTATPTEEPDAVDQPENTAAPSWGRIDLTAYLDGTHTPQEPALLRRTDGVALLYAGRVHSFHGESESGKSWAALVAARDVLGDGGRVVMLDYESDAATVVSRLLALGVDRAAIAERFDYRRPEVGPNATAEERAAWFELLSAPAALVILDGVTEALATVAATSTDNDEVTRWVREVARRLAQRTGGAVVMVDHVTKDADTRGRFAIGGQAKMAALDGAAYVVDVVSPLGVGMRGALALRVAKDRPGRVRPHAGAWRKSDRTQEAAVLTIDSTAPGVTVATLEPPRTSAAEASAPRAADEPWRPTNLMERASRVAQAAGEPLSRNVLAAQTGGNKQAALTAVGRLVIEGYLAADGPSRGGHPALRFVRPYSEAGDRFQSQNQSTSSQPASGTGTGSRSIDRDAGTSHRNQSDLFCGTSQNQSGTSENQPPALEGVDLDEAAGKPCSDCSHRIGHAPSCSVARPAATLAR